MYGNTYLIKRLCHICFDLKCNIFPAVVAIGALAYGAWQAADGAKKSKEAQTRANEAFNEIKNVAAKKLQYATELDTEWNDTFGGATKAAAKYYSELTSESLKQQYELTGNQAQVQNMQNFQNQMKQLDTKINQMGMQNSSQALSALMQMSSQQMANNAAINFETQMNKMKADQEVAEQQAAWSQQGNSLKTAAIETKNQAYTLEAQAWSAKMGNEQAQANYQQQRSEAGIGMAINGATQLGAGLAGGISGLTSAGLNNGEASWQNEYTRLSSLRDTYKAGEDEYDRLSGLMRDHINYKDNYVNATSNLTGKQKYSAFVSGMNNAMR